jgi:hypothetical protein
MKKKKKKNGIKISKPNNEVAQNPGWSILQDFSALLATGTCSSALTQFLCNTLGGKYICLLITKKKPSKKKKHEI